MGDAYLALIMSVLLYTSLEMQMLANVNKTPPKFKDFLYSSSYHNSDPENWSQHKVCSAVRGLQSYKSSLIPQILKCNVSQKLFVENFYWNSINLLEKFYGFQIAKLN